MNRPSFSFESNLSKRDIRVLQDEWDRHIDLKQSIENNHFDNRVHNAKMLSATNESNQLMTELKWAEDETRWAVEELSWYVETMNEEIKLSNIILSNIVDLLKVSDSSKEKEEQIEKGLQFFHNSKYNPNLCKDAEECFLAALEIDKRDWFVMQRLGYIYLFANNKSVRDISKAEELLKKSLGYSEPMTHSNSMLLSNYLVNAFTESGQRQMESADTMKAYTAYSYFILGQLYSIKAEFKNLLDCFASAYNLQPQNTEYIFCYAKALVVSNNGNEAANNLCKIVYNMKGFNSGIHNEESYSNYREISSLIDFLKNEISNDKDLKISKEVNEQVHKLEVDIQNTINNATEQTKNKAQVEYDKCKNVMIANSRENATMNEIKDLLTNIDFLSVYKAFIMLTTEKNRQRSSYIVENIEDKYVVSERIVDDNGNLYDYLFREKESKLSIPTLQKNADKNNSKETTSRVMASASGFAVAAGGLGGVIGFFKGCNISEFSEDLSVLFGTMLVFALIGGAIGALIGYGKTSTD